MSKRPTYGSVAALARTESYAAFHPHGGMVESALMHRQAADLHREAAKLAAKSARTRIKVDDHLLHAMNHDRRAAKLDRART